MGLALNNAEKETQKIFFSLKYFIRDIFCYGGLIFFIVNPSKKIIIFSFGFVKNYEGLFMNDVMLVLEACVNCWHQNCGNYCGVGKYLTA